MSVPPAPAPPFAAKSQPFGNSRESPSFVASSSSRFASSTATCRPQDVCTEIIAPLYSAHLATLLKAGMLRPPRRAFKALGPHVIFQAT